MDTADPRRLRRFSRTERTVHWVHAAAFVVLLVSGLCLYLPSLAELTGRRPILKTIHVYTAVGWIAALLLIVAFGDRRSLRATVTASFASLFAVTGALLWYGERDTRFALPTRSSSTTG